MSAMVPPLLAADPSWAAVCALTERFAALPVAKAVVWHLGSADNDTLRHIAALLGIGEVDLSGSPVAVLQQAVDMRRRRGTELAIRGALEALGFGAISFLVAPTWLHDGTIKHDGLYRYGPLHWAVVVATIESADGPLTADEAIRARRAADGAKSLRDRVHIRVNDLSGVTLQFLYADG
jgi:hypothetical protein